MKQNNKGITLIALVITIIVLLILAGVTINLTLGEHGIFRVAQTAARDYNKKALEEKIQLLYAERVIDENTGNPSAKRDVTSVLEEMATGTGEITKEDIDELNELLEPYGEHVEGVTSEEELKEALKDRDGIYVQLGDITISDTVEQSMVGTADAPFTGVYNGNGKTINDLTINAESDNAGMFGVNEGTIRNLKIDKCTVNAGNYGSVGAIAGRNKGLIENCTIENGTVSTGEYPSDEALTHSNDVGGVCGMNEGGIIRNCKNSSDMDLSDSQLGRGRLWE